MTTEATPGALGSNDQLGVDLLGYSRRFRDAVLGRAPSERMCYVVSGPLCAAIVALGFGARLVKTKVARMEHIFIRLDDGRVLDATADQFAHFADVGPIYLGEPVKRLHGGWKAWRDGHSWLALIRGFERLQPDLDATHLGNMIRRLYETMPGEHQFSAAFGGRGLSATGRSAMPALLVRLS